MKRLQQLTLVRAELFCTKESLGMKSKGILEECVIVIERPMPHCHDGLW